MEKKETRKTSIEQPNIVPKETRKRKKEEHQS